MIMTYYLLHHVDLSLPPKFFLAYFRCASANSLSWFGLSTSFECTGSGQVLLCEKGSHGWTMDSGMSIAGVIHPSGITERCKGMSGAEASLIFPSVA